MKKFFKKIIYISFICIYFFKVNQVESVVPYYYLPTRKILQNICGDKKPVILTVRELERENSGGMRSIKFNIWENIINKLENSDYKLIIVRDTHAAVNTKPLIKNVQELQVASFHLHLRYAFLELAHINFFKNIIEIIVIS